jgi:ammonia channel protein AmtB
VLSFYFVPDTIRDHARHDYKDIKRENLSPGLTYWIFGYGMSFGEGPYSNSFIGMGDFLVDPPVGDELMGPTFASFLFQLSFATTATTIVSGAMAER